MGSGWRSLGGTSSVFCYQSMAVYESLALSKPIAIEFWLPGESFPAGRCLEQRSGLHVRWAFGTALADGLADVTVVKSTRNRETIRKHKQRMEGGACAGASGTH